MRYTEPAARRFRTLWHSRTTSLARINALRLFGSYQKLLLVAYIIRRTASTELHPNEGCLLVIENIALLGKPLYKDAHDAQ
jgi:hypothetical protein